MFTHSPLRGDVPDTDSILMDLDWDSEEHGLGLGLELRGLDYITGTDYDYLHSLHCFDTVG